MVPPSSQPRAALVPTPAPPEPPNEPTSHQAVVTVPDAWRILFAVASPRADEIFGLAQKSTDTYGGEFFFAKADGNHPEAEIVASGTNLDVPEAPAWSPDGSSAYFILDSGNFLPPSGDESRGLFARNSATGTVTQVLSDSLGGFALSPDGSLAASWNYSAGDKLTVFDLKARRVVRAWAGQVHSADDLILSDLAFAPDGKSLLARLFKPDEDPVLRYDLASGKVSPFAKNVQSMAHAGNSLYLLEFVPVPFTNQEHPHRLLKWTGTGEPAAVLETFLYDQLAGSPNSSWLIGGGAVGYGRGAAVYDTDTGLLQAVGASCNTAVVTSSGKILYTFGGELIDNASLCSGPPPRQLQ